MKDSRPFQPKDLNGPQWFLFLVFMGLITRIPLLGLASAENTDGVLSLTYFSPDLVSTPRFVILPGYPALLVVGGALGDYRMVVGKDLVRAGGPAFLDPPL